MNTPRLSCFIVIALCACGRSAAQQPLGSQPDEDTAGTPSGPPPPAFVGNAPSDLSTGSADAYGALVVSATPPAPAGPTSCMGDACLALLNSCDDASCNDIATSCTGDGCSLTVYANASVAACLVDVTSRRLYGCRGAGITAVPFTPAPSGSLLALYSEDDAKFLASVFVSSAPRPERPRAQTPPASDAVAACALPTGAVSCDEAQALCTLTRDLAITGAACRLDVPYTIDVNGYGLSAETSAFFSGQLRNSTNRGSLTLSNLVLVAPDATATVIDLSQALGVYRVALQNISIFGGAVGVAATDVNLEVDSCRFNDTLTGVSLVRNPAAGSTGQSVLISGCAFADNDVGVHIRSNYHRDAYVSVWQLDGSDYQDPVYKAPQYPVDDESPSNVGIYGNLFTNAGTYAINLERINGGEIFANEVDGFAGTAVRAFKSFHPFFDTNWIHNGRAGRATIGIALEYSLKEGVVRNRIEATTAVTTHSYGGQYRHTQGIYFNELVGYVGVMGVWDAINSGTLQTDTEQWTNWMSDAEVSGNNFAGYDPSLPFVYTPVTSFANQSASAVPDLYVAGATASYPVYPFDRIHDPTAQVSCAAGEQRTWHISKAAEQTVACADGAKLNSPFWIGNYYAARMRDNADAVSNRVLTSAGADGYFDIPVWTVSAPTNTCFDASAAATFALGFASLGASDYMPASQPIAYAGLCDLGPTTISLGRMLPQNQDVFPAPASTTSGYRAYATRVLQRTDGLDTCGTGLWRPEFPKAVCPQ